jgi:hypothetical protein
MNSRPGVPIDIFRAMRKVIAKERAVRRTRDQVRRVRVILSGVSGRCATTPAAGDCLLGTHPVGCFIAAPQQGLCRFAPVKGDSST